MTVPASTHDEAETLLTAIGYQPASQLADAAARLSRAPTILDDVRDYVSLGQPAPDITERTPACLYRPLPLDLCVADLMWEALLAPSGAFLLAARLLDDPIRGEALLASMLADGGWISAADGTRSLWRPPLARRYPRCPVCGHPQLRAGANCGHCDVALMAIKPTAEQQQLADFLDWLDTQPETSLSKTCATCGRPLNPGARFCGGCGTKTALD